MPKDNAARQRINHHEAPKVIKIFKTMKCKFCKATLDDGAVKCRFCHEFLVDLPRKTGESTTYSGLQFIADLSKAVTWPLILLIIIIIFQGDFSDLFKRTKSFEIAGAKSEFVDYAAAFGYLEKKVAQLAAEPEANARQKLKQEIESTTKILRGMHPLSLAFLVEIGRGVVRDDSWAEHAGYIFKLKELGFITLSPNVSKSEEITKETQAKLTELGNEFLDGIGYSERITKKRVQTGS